MRKIEIIGKMDNSDGSHEMCNRVYGKDGLSPTIPTATGGGHMPKVLDTVKIKQANKEGYIECEIGGGGRHVLSVIRNQTRSSDGTRPNLSDTDNGEQP